MSLAGPGTALVATALIWFTSTGLIAWAANRPRATFGRSLAWGGWIGAAGLTAVALSARSEGAMAAYAGFSGALAIWGWLELAFLTGAVTGPRRAPCPPSARGWRRFRLAAATVMHHELALGAALLLLVSLSWGAPNPTGALAFALLFALRLSAKINIFAGAPNFSDELLPAHLSYLKSYFGPRRLRAALVVSVALTALLALWLAARALGAPAGSGAAASAGLLAALAALGALEHLFLALPLRDAALWRWAMPARH